MLNAWKTFSRTLVLGAFAVLLIGCGGASKGVLPGDASAGVQEIFQLINDQRGGQGLSALKWNAELGAAAEFQARTMAELDQLDHSLSGSSLPSLTDRLSHFGYSYRNAAENIAYNYSDAAKAVNQWVTSSGHWANIINAQVTETGIGIAEQSGGKIFYCQVFGRR